MQDYLSGIIRVVISERFLSDGRPEPRTAPDPVRYPFNPFGCVAYPASGSYPGTSLFGGPEMGAQGLPYGNAYLPYGNYSNQDMYYYRMYGAYQQPPKAQSPAAVLPENHPR
jgi:hypothetical protein